jgi:hypothetical protein
VEEDRLGWGRGGQASDTGIEKPHNPMGGPTAAVGWPGGPAACQATRGGVAARSGRARRREVFTVHVARLNLIHAPGLVLSSVGPYPADRSYSNFHRLALADGNYLISISFSSSRQKLRRPMKGSVFLVVCLMFGAKGVIR